LSCLPGYGVHHHGANRARPAVAIVGTTHFVRSKSGNHGKELRLMGLLIQHGTVITADKTLQADILIEGETIKEIRNGIPPAPALKPLDATGMLLLPGGIDAHTHLDMPFGGTTSSDDFETGTRAAAIGGTTCIVDFAIQGRGTHMRDALDTWAKKAQGKAT